MEVHYSSEKGVQIILALLKKFGIKKIITSPGGTNVSFVVSVQFDPYFEVYSCVDERSAAYMAVGMATESNEPIVINCTGATSSRNWMPALTEAYYRKLPILAITSSQVDSRKGQLVAQVTDRSMPPSDVAVKSYHIGLIKDEDDLWDRTIKVNSAIAYLTKRGGGPVHLNLETCYSQDFSVTTLPDVRQIVHYYDCKNMPEMPQGKIGITIGSHREMTVCEQNAIDAFCERYDAVVLCDHTSGYHGKYRIQSSLILCQKYLEESEFYRNFALIINMGEMSGDYFSTIKPKDVWRVSLDDEVRDKYHKLTKVFALTIEDFFTYYANKGSEKHIEQWQRYNNCYEKLLADMPELPYSNAYVAKTLASSVPQGSYVHLGILNSLRCWNLFKLPDTVKSACNVGGFGIDGVLSTAIGASLVNKDKLHFCVLGDLSFFYDLNSVGNRHIGNNLRIVLINNGIGVEFRTYGHIGDILKENTNPFVAAEGHFGHKSNKLVKNFMTDLGFEYLSATNKEELEVVKAKFLSTTNERPILLEVFTNTEEEKEASTIYRLISQDKKAMTTESIKKRITDVIGKQGIETVKKLLGK